MRRKAASIGLKRLKSAPVYVVASKLVDAAIRSLPRKSRWVAVFGDAGRHARAAVGVASLPAGAAVEVDAVVELK